ncbi:MULTISPECIES: 2OG-Fe(II) oxygenase [Marinobacter]|jgi:SM-20-related protein|uniref:2OG-Fe(II) oxygenase n=1 Tax=Marinobacter TaxID=2742 RepID=UPI002005333F|nr:MULTISPECIES: 2OG-Fe(II) oxygenase [Marinobacter]MCK7550015.1 2OG-Fe(II) oxygenase [Marinobacter goseongensis]MDV3503531.1 2OG-Fe(II) oxygenase [Marinobacter sp. M-5]
MKSSVIRPIRGRLPGGARPALGAVSGDVDLCVPAREAPAIDVPVSEAWLDTLAAGLTDSGWMSLDVREKLGRSLLQGLLDEVRILDVTESMKDAGIGRGADLIRDRSVRRDKIAWLQGATVPQQLLLRFLDEVRMGLNRRLFLGLKRIESHYATYHSGDFYRRHVDSFAGRASRVVSLVLYLNDEWASTDGGALQIYSRDSQNKVCGTVLPEMGRIALFMSEDIPHEVLPANRTRYSLACWFRQDEVPLPL